jgi:hypothetical protein
MRRILPASLVLIVAVVAMVTAFTAASYGGTCAKLTGFAGLLQMAGMVTAGPCTVNNGGKCPSAACTTADKKPGKCTNIAATGPANCACVASTVSKGLR